MVHNFNGMDGVFGNSTVQYSHKTNRTRHLSSSTRGAWRRSSHFNYIGERSDLSLADIIFFLLICVGIVAAFMNWQLVMDFLFFKIMFPVIQFASKILSVVIIGGSLYGYIALKIRRRRRARFLF